MKRRACTARLEHGRTKTKPCRNVAPCTRVRIYNEAGELLITRWVCPTCRERMRLPDHDVDFRPGQTDVGDEVVYDFELADGGVVDLDQAPTVGEGGFRLP